MRAIAHGVRDSAHQVGLLGIGRRRRLATRSVDDQRVVALLIDEATGKLRRFVEVQLPARPARTHHGRHRPPEGTAGIAAWHATTLPPWHASTSLFRIDALTWDNAAPPGCGQPDDNRAGGVRCDGPGAHLA